MKILSIWLATACLALTISGCGGSGGTTPPAPVSAPNVVADTQTAATTAITGAGLVVGTVTMQSSSTVAAGTVISESPAAGTSVSGGSAVNLVVSSGPPPVAVPNVVGDTQAAATTAIKGAGLVVGTVTMQSSSTVAAGTVISESPAAGTSVAGGSAVGLVVSSGAAQSIVPNVVGDTQSSATTAITGAGLTLGTVTQGFSSTAAFGSIMSQSPAAGAAATAGSAVNLVVSSTFAALSVTMVSARAGHTATLLNGGEVILMGGDDKFPSTGTTYATAELYNPTANTFTAISAAMTTARENFASALLPNGQVLITGGFNNNSADLNTAELYDPVAGTFTALNVAMTSSRSAHTATLLQSGKVLITGGSDQSGSALSSAELYDPVAQTFTAITAAMTTGRQGHTATLLADSTVLLTGGFDPNKNNLNTAEIYDPVANSFTALSATMTTARALHRAALLASGQVLITGGGSGPEVLGSLTVLNTAEVYDPTAKTFNGVPATLTVPRAGHTETLLPGGQILITGGASSTSSAAALATAEQSAP